MFDDSIEFLYARRVNDDSVPYHFQGIDPEEIELNKPTVLVLGGGGTFSDKEVNSYMKLVQNMLGTFATDAEIDGVSYQYVYEGLGFESFNYNAELFVKQVLLRLVSNGSKNFDFKQICKNFRNLTIFAHCYGTKYAEMILTNLEKSLRILKFSKAEIQQIMEQIFVVSFAYEPTELKCKSLTVISPYDSHIHKTTEAWELLFDHLDATKMSETDRQKFLELNNIYGKKARQHSNKFFEDRNRVFTIKRNNHLFLAPSIFLDKGDQEHSTFFLKRGDDYSNIASATKTGSVVADCISSALCNSVANSILNQKSDKLIPLELEEIKLQLDEIVRPLNAEESSEKIY